MKEHDKEFLRGCLPILFIIIFNTVLIMGFLIGLQMFLDVFRY